MSMMTEFKEFALRGNMVDLAVGIVVGGAFSGLVQSFVKDVMMPPIGLLIGGVDFNSWSIPLGSGQPIAIGTFITTLLNFLILAFSVFMVIKAMNKMADKAIARPVASTKPV